MIKKILIVFILILFSSTLLGQEIRKEIYDLVQKIESVNILESEYVGYSGSTTDQYRYFDTLSKIATIDELLQLTKYKNPVIKGYASWALSNQKYPNLVAVFSEFLNTNEMAKSQDGCIVSDEKLSNLLYFHVFYDELYSSETETDSLYYLYQIQKMDSLLINNLFLIRKTYKDTIFKDYLTFFVLSKNNANPKAYTQIKELAKIYNEPFVLSALAAYKISSDIPFLIQQGVRSFDAISVFPDSAFWNFLIQFQSSEFSKSYFAAIASYKNKDAITVLNDFYNRCNPTQILYLHEVLNNNYCPLYQDLILKIWENYNLIDYKTLEKLIIEIPEKSSESFAKGLLKKQIDYKVLEYKNIITPMLHHIKKYNNKKIVPICKKNILEANSSCLIEIIIFVDENKITKTKEVILQRLKEKNYAIEIYHLTETLLFFNNKKINNQIKNILIANQKDWDWGNWSDSFRELLMEYNIEIEKIK